MFLDTSLSFDDLECHSNMTRWHLFLFYFIYIYAYMLIYLSGWEFFLSLWNSWVFSYFFLKSLFFPVTFPLSPWGFYAVNIHASPCHTMVSVLPPVFLEGCPLDLPLLFAPLASWHLAASGIHYLKYHPFGFTSSLTSFHICWDLLHAFNMHSYQCEDI
jgi:hypothetical protein